ncbi:MAG: ATP-dependent DNA ligase [Acidobacteria bacterium]|nr:ATP-dependent DNA ligase [Acidobacteriota bacterium]MBI3658330.1 ATP-dependent DNA ligase [Acidobacteriota bacterium]
MLFAHLVEYFEKLESTSKRLEMFSILSELFQRVEKDEIDKVIYLCEEQLQPPFRGVEIGMAEKLVERAIARAAGTAESTVRERYNALGDAGLVAEEFLSQPSTGAPLAVATVYEELLQISGTSGEGSVDRKIGRLADLLSRSNAKEARYITRFVVGNLRLGIGDPTLMEALSKAIAGDRSLRPTLERGYNICSDLGLVAKTLMNQGIAGIERLEAHVGNPIRMALAERLTRAAEIVEKLGRCSVESKYDGLRCQVHKNGNRIDIFSRNQERMTDMFPDLADAARTHLVAEQAIFEGEALAMNEETEEMQPFQVTVQRKRKHGVDQMAKDFPLSLFAFDLLYRDGKDLTKQPYEDRRNQLDEIIRPGGRLRLANRIVTDDTEEIELFFDENISHGLEGIMAKKLDSPYQAGARNFNWIKLKRSYKGELIDTVDVVLVGYFLGRGMRVKFGIGALLGAVYDDQHDTFRTIAKIGSGLTEENWVKVRQMLDEGRTEHKPARVDSLIEPDVWTTPTYVFSVLADEITKSTMHTCNRNSEGVGFALRFPRIKEWVRVDKKPEDATTVTEIVKMFAQQKGGGAPK